MIDISGHLRDVRRDVGFSDFERELVLNCCGYQFFNKNNYSRIRPNGRFDYLLMGPSIIQIPKAVSKFFRMAR